jgi:hypothetical protein
MPLILPNAPQFSRYVNNFAATPAAAGFGTTVNHNGVAHTKSASYTELIAATAFDAQLVIITVQSNFVAGADSSTLTDIAIGAAASETDIIPSLASGWCEATNTAPGPRHFIFPMYVPSGSRVSARSQSVRITGSVTVGIELFGGPKNPDAWWCGTQVTAYGANAGTSAGTGFTPGNTGAEGTGVSVGTTTAAHKALVLGVQGNPSDTTVTARGYHFDIGLDSSSTEWFETDRYFATSSTSEVIVPGGQVWWPVYRSIPSGTELMVRGECSGTADALTAIIYGVS